MTPDFLRASLNGDIHEAEALLALSLPDDWPDIRCVLELRLERGDHVFAIKTSFWLSPR